MWQLYSLPGPAMGLVSPQGLPGSSTDVDLGPMPRTYVGRRVCLFVGLEGR